MSFGEAFPSKNDPDLSTETRDIKYKYPFTVSTSNFQPVKSRFLMTLRTRNDFNDINKLGSHATVEAMHIEANKLNPY